MSVSQYEFPVTLSVGGGWNNIGADFEIYLPQDVYNLGVSGKITRIEANGGCPGMNLVERLVYLNNVLVYRSYLPPATTECQVTTPYLDDVNQIITIFKNAELRGGYYVIKGRYIERNTSWLPMWLPGGTLTIRVVFYTSIVTIPPIVIKPTVNLSASPTSGNAPLAVTFTMTATFDRDVKLSYSSAYLDINGYRTPVTLVEVSPTTGYTKTWVFKARYTFSSPGSYQVKMGVYVSDIVDAQGNRYRLGYLSSCCAEVAVQRW